MKRPDSLAEVALLADDPRAFSYALADFLDQFRLNLHPASLEEVPMRLSSRYADGEVADAYLAAVAVTLAREIGVNPPTWVWDEARTLRRPWFAHPGPALRATLLAESPAAFRERNLFVSSNVLARA